MIMYLIDFTKMNLSIKNKIKKKMFKELIVFSQLYRINLNIFKESYLFLIYYIPML